MSIDWAHELDRAIGHGQDQPPLAYVAPGRRALRRRRAGVSAGTAAAVVVVVLGLGATLGGASGLLGEGPTGTGVAVDPSGGDGSRGTTDGLTIRCALVRAEPTPAEYDEKGALCLADGARLVERVDNPMGYDGERRRSVGLLVEVDGEQEFVFATWRRGSTSQKARPAVGELTEWLRGQVAAQRRLDGGQPAPPFDAELTLSPGGEVLAGDGVTVLEQRSVDLGESFAPAGSPAAAARVESDGETAFVLLRLIDGTTDVIPSGDSFESLDAFVADAREQYDSGEGLL